MNNTIFDDVFRTMVEKIPQLAVPLINEVFQTSYPEDVEIIQLRNEHHQENGEIITDSCLRIGRKLYHIECQSVDDTTMAIRMIEYDFAIALDSARKYGRRYRIPTVKLDEYTKDKIFEKNLRMFLPFYIMRYEKKKHDMRKNLELLQILLDEYDEIRINLEKELTETGKAELYTNLTKLIVKIADHIFEKEEDIRKGIGDVMGGKVLELESERLKAEGEARLGDLINRLIQDQRMEEIQMASTDPEKREQLYKEYGI